MNTAEKTDSSYYQIIDGSMSRYKRTTESGFWIPMCNFSAQIIKEEIHDDGLEKRRVFIIEGQHHNRSSFPQVRVNAESFSNMNWITSSWGSKPIVYAGNSNKDHLRAAIQTLSPNIDIETVYLHTGWRKFESEWVFLHAGGAIGKNGHLSDFTVNLQETKNAQFKFAHPPTGEDLRKAIRASLSLATMSNGPQGCALLAATYRAPLNEALPSDNCVFLEGRTGTFKSCAAALAQAHFGNFEFNNLPANWTSTENALERQAFIAKDVLFTIDDFNPRGTNVEIQKFYQKADRVIRAAGNQAGRGRMRADGSLRPEYYPRCQMLSTGEEVPNGHSLRSRMFIIEFNSGDISPERLSQAQEQAVNGFYGAAMSGYIKWLASQIDSLKNVLPIRFREIRSEFHNTHAHRRTPGNLANFLIGLEQFFNFAQETGAIDLRERESLETQAHEALFKIGDVQAEYLSGEDPCQQFINSIAAALIGGRAHLAHAENGGPPKNAERYGWRVDAEVIRHPDHPPQAEWKSRGEKIGWINNSETEIYLNPELAYGMVQKFLREQDNAIPLSSKTLWSRMGERKFIIRSSGEEKNQTKRMVERQRLRVICIPTHFILPPSTISGASGAEKSRTKLSQCVNDQSDFDFNGPERLDTAPLAP